MARITTIQGFGDAVNANIEQLLREAVLETDSRLKQASPVDTGRFRASWQVGENAVGSYDAGPQQSPVNEDRSLTKPPNKPSVELRKMNYEQERLGNVYSVHNNLPYAEPLANGSSKQADPGWVEGVAKDIQGFVQRTADRIARQS
jgi:hypothetical protein